MCRVPRVGHRHVCQDVPRLAACLELLACAECLELGTGMFAKMCQG